VRRIPGLATALAAPFLVGAAPIVALWLANRVEFEPAVMAGPLFAVWIVAAIVLAIAWTLSRSVGVAALCSALFVGVVVFFGDQLDVAARFSTRSRAEGLIGPIAVIDIALLGVALAGITWLGRRRGFEGRDAARALAVGAIAWILLAATRAPRPIEAGGAAAGEYLLGADAAEPAAPTLPPLVASPGMTLPDVYWIILDGYTRADVLAEVYGLDNEPFLDALRDRGFVVADGSYSNYPATHLSLGSTLQMRYLTPELAARRPLRDYVELIRDGEVQERFKSLGYRYVLVRSIWQGTADSPLADVRLGLGPAFGGEFTAAVVERSLVRAVAPPTSVAASHLAAFDDLETIPDDPAPTFTMAHMVLPHPPFVLDRDGRILSNVATLTGSWARTEDRAGYAEQVRFANRRFLEMIDSIRADSAAPPIVIVQGDHGVFGAHYEVDDVRRSRVARLAILNAYLVPDAMRSRLYPSISPVNSFRLVLSVLGGQDPVLLPDRHFAYDGPARDGFEEVEASIAP
jgi:hypothetical protein